MQLSAYTLKYIQHEKVVVPGDVLFTLPEKVLQFGAGVQVRGLPDYFIDKANRYGVFNGRIVVVQSTDHPDSPSFDKQDGLYTMCIRGVTGDSVVEENIINCSISRVLSANAQWSQILECAHDPNIKVVISNTTELGIELTADDVRKHPPSSFPGKLVAFLFERFKAFNGSADSGLVILPTELIVDNGKKLESIILELAHLNNLDGGFIEWLENENHFCNSFVDGIVPGKPSNQMKLDIESNLGYKDDLMIIAESYRLWAIEGNQSVKKTLSFHEVDDGVIIEPDVNFYRELKLRILNGTHTLSCGLAFLSGFDTVKEAMDNEAVSDYVSKLMFNELAPNIAGIELQTAHEYSGQVIERFKNPFLEHRWTKIAAHYSLKMRTRVVPLLLHHYRNSSVVPEYIALGFAGYLLFMKGTKVDQQKVFGTLRGEDYQIEDDAALTYFNRWKDADVSRLVRTSLSDVELWDSNLAELSGFSESVARYLQKMVNEGARDVLYAQMSQKVAS